MNNQKPTKGRPSQPTEMTVRDGEIVRADPTRGTTYAWVNGEAIKYDSGLERLKAEAAAFKAQRDEADLKERRRASALKGWQTRRTKAKAHASFEEVFAAFQERVGEFEEHAKRALEQQAIWDLQRDTLIVTGDQAVRFIAPRQTLLQRIVVAILGKLGVR